MNKKIWIGWDFDPEYVKKNADMIVIPSANQLGPHNDLGGLAAKLEKTGLPIGLGAQAPNFDVDIVLKEGTLRWIELINSKSINGKKNIYTRGSYTTGQLIKLGVNGSTAGGCPSYLMNTASDLGERIYKNWSENTLPRRINVAGGHQRWPKITTVEHQLISLMMDPVYPGEYIVQATEELVKASVGDFAGIDAKELDKIHSYTVPHYSREQFYWWCENYMRSYYDTNAWMATLKRSDLTIGARYHGVALALQTEKMGVTITIDSRTKELCEQTGVPNLSVDDIKQPITRNYLKKLINFDPINYDKHRSDRAKNYMSFLIDNELVPADYLKSIADAY